MTRKPNLNPDTGHDQDKCPQCNRFLPYDGTAHVYHCAEKVPADEWDMHPAAAFCSQKCADRFHAHTSVIVDEVTSNEDMDKVWRRIADRENEAL